MPAQPGTVAAVFLPRKHGQAPPVITPWANGAGAKLALDEGTDYVLLSDQPTDLATEGQLVSGRAAVIRLREKTTVLTLLWGTCVGSEGVALTATDGQGQAASGAISVTVDRATGRCQGEADGAARVVTLRLPGAARPGALQVDGKPVNGTVKDGALTFSLPAGKHTFSAYLLFAQYAMFLVEVVLSSPWRLCHPLSCQERG